MLLGMVSIRLKKDLLSTKEFRLRYAILKSMRKLCEKKIPTRQSGDKSLILRLLRLGSNQRPSD